MRFFNTSGPCDPDKHYTVMREGLVAKGTILVDQGRYFTIFAPRQAGKTTYFQLLLRRLQQDGYTPIWISFEGLKTLARAKFYSAFALLLQREFSKYNITVKQTIEDQFDLQLYWAEASVNSQKIVLIIDEFEDVPSEVVSELMHTFRALYQKREYHKLHALILVGVSTLAELVLSSASPFNVVDELRIPYFTFAEVQDLIQQYVTETGQTFDEQVIRSIDENTAGQPGLVCALCHYLVTEMAPDRTQPVTMTAFYPTLKHFLTERFDKNIINIVQKAREKRELMLRVLFGDTPIPFTVDNPDIAYLFAHGVIDNRNGEVDVLVPLYSKRLIEAFRPAINGDLILHQDRRYLIETKVFTDQYYFQQGKQQLADYLATEGLTTGYYVVFSNKHSKDDALYFDELIDGKRIFTYIILTHFDQPSRRTKPKRNP